MDSRKLAHFLAVVDHGGFSAAAQAVHVSQPALSLAVKDLEVELGATLFTRHARKVRLTAAGEALVGPARQVARDIATGRAAVASVAGLNAGNLTMASLPTLVADPLADLIGAFRRDHDQIRIDLAAPEDTDELLDLVHSGSAELGVTEAHRLPDVLISHRLGRQNLVLILPPGSATQTLGSIGLADMEEIPFVLAPSGTSTSRLLMEAFAAVERTPHVAVVTAERDAIVPLVVAGAGAALGARISLRSGRDTRGGGGAARACDHPRARAGAPARITFPSGAPFRRDECAWLIQASRCGHRGSGTANPTSVPHEFRKQTS